MESDWDDMDAFGDNMHAFDTIDVDASSIFEMFANQWFARLANRGELGQKVVMTETTEIRRERLPDRLRKLTEGVQDGVLRTRISREIGKRTKPVVERTKQKIEAEFKKPPFLRMIDKLSFVIGVLIMIVTEYMFLEEPEQFHHFYAALITIVIVARYVQYHALKYHYFLLDFCYYNQIILLYYCYVRPHVALFQICFLYSGVLSFAVIMWHNSLVFHDWDKMTSLIVHLLPSMVCYTIRWRLNIWQMDTEMSWWSLVGALLLYALWQAVYLIKTEVIDRKKLNEDDEMMTSLRWMTRRRPHPIYRKIRSMGFNPNPVALIVVLQFLITLAVCVPMMFCYQYRWAHLLFLFVVLMACLRNGAAYYFEVFTEQYVTRLKKASERAPKPSTYSTSLWSLIVFTTFFVLTCLSMYCTIEYSIYLATPDYE